MTLNMKTCSVLMLLALTTVGAMAANTTPPLPAPPPSPSSPNATPDSEPPGFADGWRLSGILKQGGRLQASLEHASRKPRFVVEGGELTAGVRVEKIDPASRSVTVRKGNLIAIIRTGSSPVIVKSSPVAMPATPPSAPESQAPTSPQRPTATAGQDASGRWGIQLSDGRFFTAEDYAARYGGVDQALARLNSRLASDLPPERKAFAQQMLTALQNAQVSSSQAPSGNTVAASGETSVGTTAVGAAPAATMAPQRMEPVEAEGLPAELRDLPTPTRSYRSGPQFQR